MKWWSHVVRVTSQRLHTLYKEDEEDDEKEDEKEDEEDVKVGVGKRHFIIGGCFDNFVHYTEADLYQYIQFSTDLLLPN